MKSELQLALASACRELGVDIEPVVEISDGQFGDYASNVALQLAGRLGKNPREIAETLREKIQDHPKVHVVTVDGPGFLNITLTNEALWQEVGREVAKPLTGQEILVEFGDPNPFKEMHIGHLYSYVVGDAICSLLESAGAIVQRLSYHGDVGLHVARALWGMKSEGVKAGLLDAVKNNIGYYYAKGAKAYEENPEAKAEIDEINRLIYQGQDPTNGLYEWGRERSFGNFDQILGELGIQKAHRYLESQSTPVGLEMVKQNIGKVFEESDGAIVYKGEKVGLHTRVFITSRGLPTYEAKDLGLTELKNRDYPNAARSVIITAHEQAEYFKVMLAALGEIEPEVAAKTKHISHGFVNLSTGKMSSRTGDVYGAVNLIVDVEQSARQAFPNADKDIYFGAVKYEFLKYRLGGDITYDVSESVSLEGNSGPYLQYAHARACSILAKAEKQSVKSTELDTPERDLLRKISEYQEVVAKATNELMPHHVCIYLYELAQEFNRFYEDRNNRIIGDLREEIRLKLVELYAQTLKSGLSLLGIEAPERM